MDVQEGYIAQLALNRTQIDELSNKGVELAAALCDRGTLAVMQRCELTQLQSQLNATREQYAVLFQQQNFRYKIHITNHRIKDLEQHNSTFTMNEFNCTQLQSNINMAYM